MNFELWAQRLNTVLIQHQSVWRHNAYSNFTASPIDDNAVLRNFLLALNDDEFAQLQRNDQQLLTRLIPYFPPAVELLELITITSAPATCHREPPVGMPGNKWQQIQAFIDAHPTEISETQANQNPALLSNTPAIEWCSGKGYLSEALFSRYALDSVGLEIDASLVDSGNTRVGKSAGRTYQIVKCDVLSEHVFNYVNSSTQVLALHACGGLHQRLLSVSATANSPRISFSPCCYHRFNHGEYQPLSSSMKASALSLSNSDLRTAVRQTCTARAGETAARRRLQARYIGLRLLLAEQGFATDTALPSSPQHWSKLSFRDWLHETLSRKPLAITIPPNIDQYEVAGAQELHKAERLDLIRMAFRRAIELRCVLDSILYLQEQHYDCTLSEFCPSSLTPRNLLVQAVKRVAI
ncbi:MAG: methyltransferase [Zhongshania sp.]|nr:methyltransferase [Zhongshania sp.]